jgi:hypothetical protein
MINSIRETARATALRVFAFSLLIKRSRIAPARGKKINRDRMGMPRMHIDIVSFFLHE